MENIRSFIKYALFILTLTTLTPLSAHNVHISWSRNPESDIQYYGIYRATAFEAEKEIAQVAATDSTYHDTDITIGEEYYYRVVAVDLANNFGEFSDPVSVVADVKAGADDKSAQPLAFELQPNYPNPFNPTTTFSYSVAKNADVSLVIFDVLGRQVKTLVNENQAAGHYSVVWDARDEVGNAAATGLYFAQFSGGDYKKTLKITLKK